MKRKIIAGLLVTLLVASILTACASKVSNTSTSDTKSTEVKNVSLNFLRIGNDKPEADYWKGIITEFEGKNPTIKINYDDAAIGDPMDTKLNTLFAANSGPDIIGHGILSVASRVELKHYAPITKYFDTWEGKSDIMPAVLENGKYKNEIYGLGYSTTPFVFAYRKDLFQKVGLNPDKAPTSWAELKEYALKLTVKENGAITQAGFAFPMTAGNFVEFDVFAFGNGATYYDKSGNPTLNTPEIKGAFDYLMSFLPDVNLPFNSNETNPFIKGNAAMTLINNVALRPMLVDEQFKDKIGIAVPPFNTKKATFSGCNMLFLGSGSKNPDQVWKFMDFALTKEQVLKRSKDLNIPVTRTSLIEEFKKMAPYNDVRAECVAIGIGMPRTVWSPTFQKLRNEMVQKVLYSKATPEQIMKETQDKLLEEIKK